MELLKQALLTVGIFLSLDFVWLALLMPKFYIKELGDLARKNGDKLDPNWTAAALVYVLIPLGLLYFVIPTVQNSTFSWAFLQGALFGLVLYGVYDLTNLSTLDGYTIKLTIVDMLWGMFICGLTTALVTRLA